MDEAEQLAIYNMQVLNLKAEVVQRFITIALIVIACVALVVAIVALCNYIVKCRAELAALKGEVQLEPVDTSYTTLNLDVADNEQEAMEEPAVETAQEEPVQKSDDLAE